MDRIAWQYGRFAPGFWEEAEDCDALYVVRSSAVALSVAGCLVVSCFLLLEHPWRRLSYSSQDVDRLIDRYVKTSLLEDDSDGCSDVSSSGSVPAPQDEEPVRASEDAGGSLEPAPTIGEEKTVVTLHRSPSSLSVASSTSSTALSFTRKDKPPGLPIAPRSGKPRIPLGRRLKRAPQQEVGLGGSSSPEDLSDEEPSSGTRLHLSSSDMVEVLKIVDWHDDAPSSDTLSEISDSSASPAESANAESDGRAEPHDGSRTETGERKRKHKSRLRDSGFLELYDLSQKDARRKDQKRERDVKVELGAGENTDDSGLTVAERVRLLEERSVKGEGAGRATGEIGCRKSRSKRNLLLSNGIGDV